MTPYQVQPGVWPGFAVMELNCPVCNYEWVGVAPAGMEGVVCPHCHLRDKAFVWASPEVDMPHDGAWLTGQWDAPWVNLDGLPVVKPWLQRAWQRLRRLAQALRAAWRDDAV